MTFIGTAAVAADDLYRHCGREEGGGGCPSPGAATWQEEDKAAGGGGVWPGLASGVVSGRSATCESDRGGWRSGEQGRAVGLRSGEKRRVCGPAWKRKKHGLSPIITTPFSYLLKKFKRLELVRSK
jgi:hypothetical protein